MVDHVADSPRRVDKTAVLRFSAHGLRIGYGKDSRFDHGFLTNVTSFRLNSVWKSWERLINSNKSCWHLTLVNWGIFVDPYVSRSNCAHLIECGTVSWSLSGKIMKVFWWDKVINKSLFFIIWHKLDRFIWPKPFKHNTHRRSCVVKTKISAIKFIDVVWVTFRWWRSSSN